MRRLFSVLIVCGVVYGAFWSIVVNAIDRGVADAVAQARSDGWDVQYSSLGTLRDWRQFRFDGVDLAVTSADGQIAWAAPSIAVSASSVRPNQIQIDFGQKQTLSIGGQRIMIAGQKIIANAGVGTNLATSFDHLEILLSDLAAQSDRGSLFDVAALTATMTQADAADFIYDIGLTATGLVLPAALLEDVDPTGQLGATIGQVTLDGSVTLDTELDRFSFNQKQPSPAIMQLAVQSLKVAWNDLTISAEGAADVDPDGILNGRITFQTAQWRELIDFLAVAGVLDAKVVPTAQNVASMLAQGDGHLALPITFRDGFMSMGPLPLGPTPRLR